MTDVFVKQFTLQKRKFPDPPSRFRKRVKENCGGLQLTRMFHKFA